MIPLTAALLSALLQGLENRPAHEARAAAFQPQAG
jgi:hypothetical protein